MVVAEEEEEREGGLMRREDRDGARQAEGGVTTEEGRTCREFWRGWKAAHDVPRIAAEAATAENLFIVKNRRTIISYYVVATLIRLLFITSRQTLRSHSHWTEADSKMDKVLFW